MTQRIDNAYTATLNDPTAYPALDGDTRADVAIIGGGFTGVATAVELAERGLSVVLLEANRIGWGASGRNGGQVTGSLSGDATMLRQLRPALGRDAAERFVWDMRWRGQRIITERVERYGIDCDLQPGHLHTAWHRRDIPALQSVLRDAESFNDTDGIAWLDRAALHHKLDTPLYHGAIHNSRNLHLHSLNLCVGEARAAASLGTRLHENTGVLDIVPGTPTRVITAAGVVRCDAAVLAGNAYHRLLRNRLDGYVLPAMLGNTATVPLNDTVRAQLNPENLAVYDSRMVLDYYRFTGDGRLLFGGGTNYSGRELGNVERALRPALERTFPQLQGVRIEHAWNCTAGIVLNRLPMLGRAAPGVYYAQGYSGHGIATSHILAQMLGEALSGTLERFDVFSSLKPVRWPLGRPLGNAALALGMQYYRLREVLAG